MSWINSPRGYACIFPWPWELSTLVTVLTANFRFWKHVRPLGPLDSCKWRFGVLQSFWILYRVSYIFHDFCNTSCGSIFGFGRFLSKFVGRGDRSRRHFIFKINAKPFVNRFPMTGQLVSVFLDRRRYCWERAPWCFERMNMLVLP